MYYKELSLPFDPWNKLPTHYLSKNNHEKIEVFNKYVKRTDFNKETLNWFSSLGLTISYSMIFSYLPNTKTTIHIDGFRGTPGSKQYSAINFSIGGEGSLEWYNPIDLTSIGPETMTAVAKSPYHMVSEKEARLLASYKIKNPVLIDVDTFHRATNDSNIHRYSLTLRWRPKMTFTEAHDLLQPYFLN